MSKFEIISLILMLGYMLDKLYLLPLSIPLNALPNSKRDASYLARTIAKKAMCDDILLFSMTLEERNNVLNTTCVVNNDVLFKLYIFLNTDIKNEWIKTSENTNSYIGSCFKKGSAYLICETSIHADKNGEIVLPGQKYYNQFPGETISYKEY